MAGGCRWLRGSARGWPWKETRCRQLAMSDWGAAERCQAGSSVSLHPFLRRGRAVLPAPSVPFPQQPQRPCRSGRWAHQWSFARTRPSVSWCRWSRPLQSSRPSGGTARSQCPLRPFPLAPASATSWYTRGAGARMRTTSLSAPAGLPPPPSPRPSSNPAARWQEIPPGMMRSLAVRAAVDGTST